MKRVRFQAVPEWRRGAAAGVSLAAAQAEAAAEAGGSQAAPGALARILRAEALGRWMLPSVAAVTPEYIEAVLRGAMGGDLVAQWELFDLMEDTWPRLAKNLNELKRAVAQMEWRIQAWAEENAAPSEGAEEKARLVSRALWSMRPAAEEAENDFLGTIFDVLDAWAKGLSVLEVDWEYRDGGGAVGQMLAPRATRWAHPAHYGWSSQGWLGLTSGERDRRGGRIVERFPEHKFVVAYCKGRTGHPLAGALLRPLAWWWCAGNFAAEWFLNFAQVFGLPIRWATYDPRTPGLLEQVADMLENMGSSAWGAFPAGTTLELKEAGKAGADNPQVALLDRADKNCDLLILGQTLTTDVGASGSRALGEVHQGVRADIIQAAADFASGVINQQMVRAILLLNYGEDGEAPEFLPEPVRVSDEKANAERDAILVRAGFRLPRAWAYKRHGIPLPQEGEEVIEAPMAGMPGLGAPAEARNAATERLLERVLEDMTGVEGKWLGGVKPYFRGLVAKARDAKVSDAEFVAALEAAQRELPELFGRLNVAVVEEALYRSLSAGCINGALAGALARSRRLA